MSGGWGLNVKKPPAIILEPVARYEGTLKCVAQIADLAIRMAQLKGYQFSQRKHGVALSVFEPGKTAVTVHVEAHWADLMRVVFEEGREDLPKGRLEMTIIPAPEKKSG